MGQAGVRKALLLDLQAGQNRGAIGLGRVVLIDMGMS